MSWEDHVFLCGLILAGCGRSYVWQTAGWFSIGVYFCTKI